LKYLGIDVGKRKCRAALKDDRGSIVDEFFFDNSYQGILELIKRIQNHGTKKCNAVLESTGNMWMRIHDTLEDYGIDTMLANTYKTQIIAQAKIKSDKLDDARLLSDLLRTGLVYESYVPVKEFREKRSLVRHRILLSRTKTKLANKIHAILDKYEYRTELTDIFSRSGINWLKSLSISPIDKIILNTTLSSIESIDSQIEIVSKEIARYAWQDSQDIKILISITGIDIFSAMLISTEIVDITRFSTPWKLVSYAGLSPSTRESSGKIKTGRITKQGSPLLRWILVQCSLSAIRHDHHMRTFYERIKQRKGHGKAIVATAKEMLVIIWYMLTRHQLYKYINRSRYERKLEHLKKIGSQ
jgi:transposase